MLHSSDCSTRKFQPVAILLLITGLAGCASTSSEPTMPPAPSHHPGLDVAASLVGTPYRYGGSTPRGFDCSGLVYYAYRKAGIRVPRSTRAQYRHAQPIALKYLQPGDLLFFKRTFRSIAHVGIYAGNGRFLHAPSRGRTVSYDSMNDPYWKRRLVAAGRYE